MQIELTQEERARVFAMYLPCFALDIVSKGEVVLQGLSITGEVVQFETENNTDWGNIEHFKLHLTPLEKISDKDAMQVAKMETSLPYNKDERKEMIRDGKIHASAIKYMQHRSIHGTIQYLIQKHYAVPLFFAPNHRANGKNAIELGLAIDKTNKDNQL